MSPAPVSWKIQPLIGVGPVKLLWSRDDLRSAMKDLDLLVTPRRKGKEEIDSLLNNSVHLHYTPENRLEAIECWIDDLIRIDFEGIDVLRDSPGKVVELFRRVAPLDRDDPELGYTYTFPDLSIGLWREFVPVSDEQKGTFQSVLIGIAGYYSSG